MLKDCFEASSVRKGGKKGNEYRDIGGRYAHHVIYEAVHGPIPKGMVIMHECDNKWCGNPDHLKLGTQSQNLKDMYVRGRQGHRLRGSEQPFSRLQPEQVREIRKLLADGIPSRTIGQQFGISHHAVLTIKWRKSWAWLE